MKKVLIVITLIASNIALCNRPYEVSFRKMKNGFSATIYKENGVEQKIKLTKLVTQKNNYAKSPFWLSATITRDRKVEYSYTYITTIARRITMSKNVRALLISAIKEIKPKKIFCLQRI